MNRRMIAWSTAAMLLAGCVATPTWQSDTSPDSEVAVIHRSMDPIANLVSIDGKDKGWGIVKEVRLSPGRHLIAFLPNPLYWHLVPTDPNEPNSGYLQYYIEFSGDKGATYDMYRVEGGRGSFRVDVVDRVSGRTASRSLGSFRRPPVLKD